MEPWGARLAIIAATTSLTTPIVALVLGYAGVRPLHARDIARLCWTRETFTTSTWATLYILENTDCHGCGAPAEDDKEYDLRVSAPADRGWHYTCAACRERMLCVMDAGLRQLWRSGPYVTAMMMPRLRYERRRDRARQRRGRRALLERLESALQRLGHAAG